MEIKEETLDRLKPPANRGKENTESEGSYRDLFVNPCIRKRILLMAVNWIAAVLCYNGLLFNSVNIGSDVYVSMALGVLIEVRVYIC